jgi:hypothetical protein
MENQPKSEGDSLRGPVSTSDPYTHTRVAKTAVRACMELSG